MTKTRFKIACAPLAIAAMAALHTVPAAAQTQPQIVLDIPETQSEPAPQATIVLPDPEPVATDPVPSQSAPVSATAAVAPKAATSTTRSSEPAPAATTSTRTPVAAGNTADTASPDTSVSSDAAILPTTDPALQSEAEMAANRAELAPAPQPIEDGSSAALILALLGVGGISLLAFFLMRRRRRADDVPVIEKPVVTRSVEPAVPPVIEREPAVTAYDVAPVATRSVEPTPVMAATAPSNGAAVELPPELPESYEERDSLLRRMIAARPDRANPFVAPRARAKRARLIMQSIGTRFNSRKPRIDLSQYTNVWPELRGWRPATA